MATKFTQITEAEFDYWAHQNSFSVVDPEASFLKLRTFEKVYVRQYTSNIMFVILSSIDVRSDVSRDLGKDAIRVSLHFRTDGDWFHYLDLSRVYRTKGWRNNLNTRIEEAIGMVSKEPCPLCASPMILRSGKYGKFYACISWSRTRCEGKEKYNE